MKSRQTLIALVAAAIATTGIARALEAATELAKVNGHVLTLEEFNKAYAENSRYFLPTRPTKKGVLEELIKRDLAIQEAKREGLEKEPDVRDQMDTVLYHALINKKLSKDFGNIFVNDDEAKEFYARNPEIRTSHIFVSVAPNAAPAQEKAARAKIQEIYDKYVRPAEIGFAEVAQRYSEGPAQMMGGDIGYQTRDKLDPAYYQAATKLRLGQTSGIVRSQFGYHIIKLTGERSWNETDHGLIKRLVIEEKRNEVFEKYMNHLRTQAKITTHPELLND